MVGLVIVSHSAALADGVVALAREMGGAEVAIEAAGGMEDGAIGTDAARVMEAIGRARSADGVLVLMDLGSALMSAEMAVEMSDPDGGPVLLSEAPLVEGAVAAAARARGGASLDEVAREARGALRMKVAQLGAEAEVAEESAPPASERSGGSELRLAVTTRLGLHARPAARIVEAVAGVDATVQVRNATTGAGPADARSLTALAVLAVRQGHEISVHATGPEADAALAAVRELAEANFGDPQEATPVGTDAAAASNRPARPGTPAEPAPDRPAAEPARPAPAPAPAPGTTLTGVAASSGIAIGPLTRLDAVAVAVDDAPSGTPAEEHGRLDEALAAARDDLVHTRATVAERAGAAEAEIFDAHAALLGDAALLGPARRAIDAGASAAAAWRDAAADVAAVYAGLDDPYLRERAADVEDVGRRVLAQLGATLPGQSPSRGAAAVDPARAGAKLQADAVPAIIVAAELTPGETAALDPAQVAGIATARGGATGHAAILARALGIPAVVGLGDGLLALDAGTTLVVDGDAGTLVVDPGEEAIRSDAARREALAARRRVALARAGEPGALRDGARVEVFANVGGPAEVAAAVEQGAEGVGLLRTELLFLDRATPPDEDEQVAVLTEVARRLEGRPLIVRTLDAGADKPLPFLPQKPEANPFLGRRGIRLSLAEPALLRTQLRAILRVAAEHPLKLMFPMVATLGEIRAARALIDEARADLDSRAALEVGVMVEVPALALAADRAALEVDFFSVGTNDLTQYTMAAERGNAALAPLLDGPLPAVLTLIDRVCRAADANGRWVGVCGELAGEPGAAVLLAGLGVCELSMAASRIPEVKAALREVDAGAAQAAAHAALQCDDATAVRSLAADLLESG